MIEYWSKQVGKFNVEWQPNFQKSMSLFDVLAELRIYLNQYLLTFIIFNPYDFNIIIVLFPGYFNVPNFQERTVLQSLRVQTDALQRWSGEKLNYIQR